MSIVPLRPLRAVHESGAQTSPDVTTLSIYEIVFELKPSLTGTSKAVEVSNFEAPATLFRTAAVAGPLARSVVNLVPGVRQVSSFVAYGAWLDELTPAFTLRLLTTRDRAVAVASALGLAAIQDEVLVTSSSAGRRVSGIEVLFLDSMSVREIESLHQFWSACRTVSSGKLTGFSPVRLRSREGIRILDLDSKWGSVSEAAQWVESAGVRLARRVAVSQRCSSALVVDNDWSRDVLGEAFARRLVASGRGHVANEATRLAAAVEAGLKDMTYGGAGAKSLTGRRTGRPERPPAA